MTQDKNIRILIAVKESAGDVFLMTGVIDSLKKKHPQSNIYLACDSKYADILDGNRDIKKVVSFHESMYNYRAYTKWAMNDGPFDIVYAPTVCTQVVPSNWLNGKYAVFLGQFYANMCNVPFGNTWIKTTDEVRKNLPIKYITVQSQSKSEVKDFDNIDDIIKRIKNIKIVQIGGARDKKINIPNIIDLRGQTTPQSLAGVIKDAILHIGMDSFPMHLAGHFGTPSIILFGGTTPQAAVNPNYKNMTIIETPERDPCITSCHLLECAAKQQGHDKCINNISIDVVIEKIENVIGQENVVPPEPIKISSYMIIKDGKKYGFPFERAISRARMVSDEVVVVDGGSTDGTWERLQALTKDWIEGPANVPSKVVALQHPWDMENPTLFGDEKTWARQQCTGNWLIQLDADEIIQEPKPGAIRELIKKHQSAELLDLPIVNFYGNDDSTRIEENCWKWRISKNNPNIIHGVHAEARQFDADTMKITMDKRKSDGCEYIYSDSLKIVPHKSVLPMSFLEIHHRILNSKNFAEHQAAYLLELEKIINTCPIVFHYSWYNLERKQANGSFWDNTYHGKKNATHNTTQDIITRVDRNKNNVGELIVYTPIDHPLKNKIANVTSL